MLDKIFSVTGWDKTFAEMKPEDKNKISHRSKALFKLKEFFTSMSA